MGIEVLITCDTGFEKVMVDELGGLLPFKVLGIASGRVFIEVYSESDIANVLRSRIANNVYLLIHYEIGISDLSTIYKVIKGIDFAKFVEPWQTFAIRPERVGEHSFTSMDIGRVAGQAVIDSYLESRGVRLKVDLDRPDIEIYVELNADRLVVALQLTRGSLHARGYKLFAHPAGLKPTIAFALLKQALWNYGKPVVDPMCGGGTIVIEAALASKGVEIPCISLDRIHMGVLKRLYPEAADLLMNMCTRAGQKDVDRIFLGIDVNPRFVEGAVINAKSAGVDDVTLFLVDDFKYAIPKIKSIEREFGAVFDIAVFNPPYGYRMRPGQLSKLYEEALRTLIDYGFRSIVFITSATRVSERVLKSFSGIEVDRLRVIHGTLPSYVYRLKL